MNLPAIRNKEYETRLEQNGARIGQEMDWLEIIIGARLKNPRKPLSQILEQHPAPEDNPEDLTFYGQFINEYQLSPEERISLILAFIPAYMPEKLDFFLNHESSNTLQIISPHLGGEIHSKRGYFIPTVKTYMYLIAGTHTEEYHKYWVLFKEHNRLIQEGIIKFSEEGTENNYLVTEKLRLSKEYFNSLCNGSEPLLESDTEYPVRLLTTNQDWDELIVQPYVLDQMQDFVDWYEQRKAVIDKDKYIKDGYLSLFYGPPGTGKTMAASLLGKRCGLPVYRIDVSLIVSKWVGETGKNIRKLFEKIKYKKCILFFDEADSLFSTRTDVSDAQDKYANQELATLLIEIESYQGMCILATNLENNIDKAFKRRLNSQVYFDRPDKELRKRLWMQYLPKGFQLHPYVDLDKLSKNIKVSGANIRNIYKMCAVKAAKRGDFIIRGNSEIVHYTRMELWKEGRLLY